MRIHRCIVIALSVAVLSAMGNESKGNEPGGGDVFAQIGAMQADYANRKLTKVTPPRLDRRLLPIDAAGTPSRFQPAPKMTTAKQLRAELLRQRERHAPFLKDLAPPLQDQRIRVPLPSFDWRVETDADRANFARTLAGQGEWQRVTIPHYGPPMGRAVTYYRTTFNVTRAMLDKGALFVRFKGVDYIAHVFVNGSLLGSHEGLFAPFEFEFTRHARLGENVLLVKVENDHIMMGNDAKTGFVGGTRLQGDKIYAAVGPGWDEPGVGWHCCPPGMGIWQDVAVEARPRVFLHDLFVHPLPEEGRAEAWIEVFNCDPRPANVTLDVSAFGQNFPTKSNVFYARVKKLPGLAKLEVVAGVSCFKIPMKIANPRQWNPDSPWLYQLQVKLLDDHGELLDTAKQQFGLRTFRMEYVKEPKGRMYLNGRRIRLRGANTMGAQQRCVMEKDWPQLIDDILLAKITHMNYLRLTQTPVQPEIYGYCDRLGLLLQTDLPLFGNVHRNQYAEVVRQASEMERLVRSHPSNILVTYMNEPIPRAWKMPQRNLTRPELLEMFAAADRVVRMANPSRVVKAVDGDYDPPGPGLPDYHCYTAWYNGHGVEMGALHKGFWKPVKPGWGYGCGEFGAEGLDPVDLMHERYRKSWLPQTSAEEKTWTPDRIPGSQTSNHHYYFFETPRTLDQWVERSHAHQAWAVRLMTEAFRRDRRMQSFAVHLFVDAFPAGWMKAIMDCRRRPKQAWFAYREALAPLMANLRTDRRAFFAGEPLDMEAWVCNDLNSVPKGATLHYQLEMDGRVHQSGSSAAKIGPVDAIYQGSVRFQAPDVDQRTVATVRLGLLDAQGNVLHDTSVDINVFPKPQIALRRVYVIGSPQGKAARLAKELGAEPVFEGPIRPDDAVLIDDMRAFARARADVAQAVRDGAQAVFLEVPKGKYRIGGTDVVVGGEPKPNRVQFVSRDTGHPLVEGFEPDDFKFWYNAQLDRPSPLLAAHALDAPGWERILLSCNRPVAARKPDGKGAWSICQVALSGRIAGNPVASIFARRLLKK
ncbi:MAG: beta galactosidase jelly roll domain-containing protein [Pirellulales bacterium]|nr:beta galactosidase jelly roll domain-containing protein [Pirellulales bacterium]